MSKTNLPLIACLSAVMLSTILISAVGAPIRLRGETIEPPAKSRLQVNQVAIASGKAAYYIVQFGGPIQEQWKSSVAALGVDLGEYVPDYGFVAKMTRSQMKDVAKLDCVVWVHRIAPRHRRDSRSFTSPRAYADVLIRLFPGEEPAEVEKTVRENGGSVFAKSNARGACLRALIPVAMLDKLTDLESVEWVEEWRQPKLSNDVAQSLVGIPNFRQRAGFYGDGQTVAFSDTGLDTGNTSTLSPDFAGRLASAYALRRTGDWSDPNGHGTHVMGTAAGAGVYSGSNPATHSYVGSYAGIAPEARFVIQSIGDSGGAVYPPVNLSDLFSPAYADGARVHSNSWGSPPTQQGGYTIFAQQVDSFCWSHKDFLVVFSAGNDGKDANADGVVDLGSLESPGTAKNCLTVGATESVRSTGGRSTGTYGSLWSSDYPTRPISTDYVSNNSSGIVAFSGRGPCLDGRIKPDICAPGTNIISCRSQLTSDTGWGLLSTNSHYYFMGGTSMSTPMVAGAAALIREYYVKNRGISPSSALVKATLLNGAKDVYPGQYGIGPKQEISTVRPNSVEGWGRLDFDSTPVPTLPRVMAFVDEVTGLQTGQNGNYSYNIETNTEPLAVTLVWTDPAPSVLTGKQLVNNLDLTVTDPNGVIYRGNGVLDNTNNVESVDIASPVAGTYTVAVNGTNVPVGPQPFALVVTGSLPAGYIAGSTLTATGAPIQGATITATDGVETKNISSATNGNYILSVSPGNYTVSASKSGWTFGSSQQVTVGSSPVPDVNFTGSAPTGSISGRINQAVGGRVNYVIESPHPYPDNAPLVYTITGQPSATHIRVHFEELSILNLPDQGYVDYLYVEKPDGTRINTYTGDLSDVWSDYVPGNSLKIEIIPAQGFVGAGKYGFYVSGYETDVISDGPLAGVTVTAQPGGISAVTGSDGMFAMNNLEPVSYTLTPSMAHWKFDPDTRSAAVPPGGVATGVDFLAYPPGSVSGKVTTGLVGQQTKAVQSPHPYPNNATLSSLPVIAPAGATWIRIHFTYVDVESGFDYVYVADGNGNVVDYLTGQYSDQWSSWINSDRLVIQLVSDDSFNGQGYVCDQFEYIYGEHNLSGIPVSVSDSIFTGRTDLSGTYSVTGIDEGTHVVTAQKPYWTFVPASYTTNVVRGLNSGGLDFFSIMSTMPTIGYVKTLADNDMMSLANKVVVAGTEQFTDHYYIEETDRSAGIRVNDTTLVTPGKVVSLTGQMGTAANGERQITPMLLTVATGTQPVPSSLLMTGLSLSGGSSSFDPVLGAGQRGPDTGIGLNNVGMLVTIYGRVTYEGVDNFYVDDGSSRNDGSGYKGVKIICENVLPPSYGQYVSVTGISSLLYSNGHYYPTIRPRTVLDVIAQPHK